MKTTVFEENGGVRYVRESYMYGGAWKSYERRVPIGTVRMIDGVLSKAWAVHKRGPFGLGKQEILWSHVSPEELREIAINERP